MDRSKKKKTAQVNKADTGIEKAVSHGLQADHPFHTGAGYTGQSEDEPRLIEEANADLADKEISQTFNNS